MLHEKEEIRIVDSIPSLSMSGLREAVYAIYKEVGKYKIEQWLHQFEHPYD